MTAPWLASARIGSNWTNCGASLQRSKLASNATNSSPRATSTCSSPWLAIISYRTGKRDSENTDLFIRDLRERVLGLPEISTDGFHPYRPAIREPSAIGLPMASLARPTRYAGRFLASPGVAFPEP
jgi:hypothetical protein